MTGDLARIGQLFFPSLTVVYIVACQMWNTPTSMLVLFALGLITLLLSIYLFRQTYYAGTIEVELFPDGTKRYSLNLEEDPADLDKRKRIIFDVEVSRD